MTTSPSKSTGTAVVAFLPRAATIISHLESVARCPFPQLQHLSGPCPQFFPFRPQSLQTWSLDKCAKAQNLHLGLVVHCLQWWPKLRHWPHWSVGREVKYCSVFLSTPSTYSPRFINFLLSWSLMAITTEEHFFPSLASGRVSQRGAIASLIRGL